MNWAERRAEPFGNANIQENIYTNLANIDHAEAPRKDCGAFGSYIDQKSDIAYFCKRSHRGSGGLKWNLSAWFSCFRGSETGRIHFLS